MPTVYQEMDQDKKPDNGGAASTVKKVLLIILIVVYVIILALYTYITVVRISATGNNTDPVYFGSKMFTTYTTTMQPTVYSGSLIIVENPDSTTEYTKGTPVAISKAGTGGVEADVYIILGTDNDQGDIIYSVGDLNSEDYAPVRSSAISGKVKSYIPTLGHVFNFINSLYGLIVIVIIPFLIILTVSIVKLMRGSKDEVTDDEFFASNVDEVQMTETGSLIEAPAKGPEVADVDFSALRKNFDEEGVPAAPQPVSDYEGVLKRMEENMPGNQPVIEDDEDLELDDDDLDVSSETGDEDEEILDSGLDMNEEDQEDQLEEDDDMYDDDLQNEAVNEGTHGIDAYMTDQGLEIELTNLKSDRVKFTLVRGGAGMVIEIGDFQAEIDVDLKSL